MEKRREVSYLVEFLTKNFFLFFLLFLSPPFCFSLFILFSFLRRFHSLLVFKNLKREKNLIVIQCIIKETKTILYVIINVPESHFYCLCHPNIININGQLNIFFAFFSGMLCSSWLISYS